MASHVIAELDLSTLGLQVVEGDVGELTEPERIGTISGDGIIELIETDGVVY